MPVQMVVMWQDQDIVELLVANLKELDEVVRLLVEKHGGDAASWPTVNPISMPDLISVLAGEQVSGVASREDILATVGLVPTASVLHILLASGDRARTFVIRAVRWLREERSDDSFCAILVEENLGVLRFRPLVADKIDQIIAHQEMSERETNEEAERACAEIIEAARTIQPGETWAEDLLTLDEEDLPDSNELEE
jgi:hypothetical protein